RKLEEQKARKLEHSAKAPTPRRPEQQPWSSSPMPRCGHQRLVIADFTNHRSQQVYQILSNNIQRRSGYRSLED
ncbi:hypothetical protein PIB30_092247, partial [Stylosanthes scabra]|nr:hypothetical protein [Stylosanthes scabra]